ncbi:hypothetical protein HII31_07781 [Pseudocercospora fuligena]|uniref:Uncharacterized protein n=1 Tax=Pseudocercospora fuligena TaxID=685502 RepID=A0A8H6RH26_9PEZI|nr:hypothetical protein HII31_07781 [Pseudocercospora fuligena]
MAPQLPALAQSESKARFFARLGLDLTNGTHRRVYNLMKMEAAEGRKRLLEVQASSTAQIHEDAWQGEVMRIYDEAQPQTLAVYRFGHDVADPEHPDNWIIRWMLWHVFRYRDYRNKNRPEKSPRDDRDPSSEDEDEGDKRRRTSASSNASKNSTTAAGTSGSSTQPADSAPTPSRTYWDPVRNQ